MQCNEFNRCSWDLLEMYLNSFEFNKCFTESNRNDFNLIENQYDSSKFVWIYYNYMNSIDLFFKLLQMLLNLLVVIRTLHEIAKININIMLVLT